MSSKSETTAKREKKAAKRYNADRVPGSGNQPWWKEDLKGTNFLYQHKFIESGTKSHRVKREDLEQLRHNAIDEGVEPAYIIDFEDSDNDYIIITKDLFQQAFGDSD